MDVIRCYCDRRRGDGFDGGDEGDVNVDLLDLKKLRSDYFNSSNKVSK